MRRKPRAIQSSNLEILSPRVEHAFQKIKTHIPRRIRKGRFLDIGCGTGNGVIAALQNGASLSVGIDRSFKEFDGIFSISDFNDICDHYRVDKNRALMLEANIFEFQFGPNSFDYAMMLDSIEHVPEPRKFIQYAFDVLRPGGYFLVDASPLYHGPVGHHLFSWFPADTDPWPHLRVGFAQRCKDLGIDAWSMERYLELNKVTHEDIRNHVLNSGFEIVIEHRDGMSAERSALYEKFKDSFDADIAFEKQWLFEQWLLIVAKKPEAQA